VHNLRTLAVIITDHEYPVRPAFSLLSKLLDDFTAKVPQSSFSNSSAISFPDINTYIQKYQDPRHADNIMRVQQELDETKIVLVRMPFRGHLLTLLRDGHSTRQSSQFCNAARSWTISWSARLRFLHRARCFTRLLRRQVLPPVPCPPPRSY
jgi:hypothetical protein